MRGAHRFVSGLTLGLALVLVACGPGPREAGGDAGDDDNGPCQPGATKDCYDGADGTEGVGPCHKGKSVCEASGTWGVCANEQLPVAENCTDGIDNNCNGQIDEDIDEDGDGFTSCSGGDCCDSTAVCSNPTAVNPGAFDAPGNLVDDDCDGVIDNVTPACDVGLASDSTDPMDYAKAIDLCQVATMADKKWGVISASWSFADGTGTPVAKQHSIRPIFGSSTVPQVGNSLAMISTGTAASVGDTNPNYDANDFQPGTGNNTASGWPADFIAANNGTLPNAPGCMGPSGGECMDANGAIGGCDPVMLTLQIRVPTNALSFSISSDFFSSEFPEYVCTQFNDFFVVLLDSTYSGVPANPTDKNLAFYTPPMTTDKYPVGVNLAFGGTGLFTQCVSGTTGCSGGVAGSITCAVDDQLDGTGFDQPESGECDADSVLGGGTGWLTTTGNVKGGEIMTLRIALWNTSDHAWESTAIIDGFTWSVEASDPGTVIGRTAPHHGGTLTIPLRR
ncbi:MAG TPA: MopE-related protein [Kofleriaceae bacterium]